MVKLKGHLVDFGSARDLDNTDEIDFSKYEYDDNDLQENDGNRWDLVKRKWREEAASSVTKMATRVEEKLKTVTTHSEKISILQKFYNFITYMSAIHNRAFIVPKTILSEFKKMKKAGQLNKTSEYSYSSGDLFIERLNRAQRKFKRQQLLRYCRDLDILRKVRSQQHLKHI